MIMNNLKIMIAMKANLKKTNKNWKKKMQKIFKKKNNKNIKKI